MGRLLINQINYETNIMTNSICQQLDVPESVRKRGGHSMSVFTMSPNCAWLVTVGGAINSKDFVTFPNIVILTEIGQYCIITIVRHIHKCH